MTVDLTPEAVAKMLARLRSETEAASRTETADMLEALAARLAEVEAERDKAWGFAHSATNRGMTAEADNARLAAELAEARSARSVRTRRTFPILGGGGASIDWQLVQDHSRQANDNHGQSVERLAQRGGLSWSELYAVLHNRKWKKVDTNDAMIACRSLEARYLAALAKGDQP